jgi:hypothetical protein
VADQYVSYSAAWFTLSLINAGLAQAKNRSGARWWLGSLFVGPLATLLLVVWPPLLPGSADVPPGRMTQGHPIALGVGIIAVVAVLAAIGGLFAGIGR